MSKLTERQEWLLRVAIEEYVKTGEAIASLNLEGRSDCQWSAPLLRIELRELEAKEMLEKHEASRGRIPTANGYSYYTQNLMTVQKESVSNEIKKQIKLLLKDRTQSVTQVIEKTCKLLSEATSLTAISKEGEISSKVLLTDILTYELENDQINVVFIYSNGEIKNKLVEISGFKSKDLITSLKIFSQRLKGSSVSELHLKASAMKDIVSKEVSGLEDKFSLLVNNIFENIMLNATNAGMSNIIKKNDINTGDKLKQLIQLIEDNSIWDIIANKQNDSDATKVSIDFLDNELDKVSIINKELIIHNRKHSIALIGSSRVDYKQVVSLLDLITEELKKF